jgi:hypothetical protein
MTDDDFDDLDFTPDEESDDHVRLSKADLKKLRSAARRAGAAERDLAAYKRQETVRTAGIEGLTERQINVLASEAGDDDSPEKLRELAVEFGWATPPEPNVEDQQREAEIDAHTAAAAVANGAEPPAQRSQVPATEIAGWPVDKRMRLLDHHPDLHELALRGEPINLPAGFN